MDIRSTWKWALPVLALVSRPESSGNAVAVEDLQNQMPASATQVYLRKMLVAAHQWQKPDILIALVVHLIKQGQAEQALDEIELYLPNFPFALSAIIHTYAGLISFYLAQPPDSRAATDSMTQPSPRGYDSDDSDSESEQEHVDSYSNWSMPRIRRALVLFNKAASIEAEDEASAREQAQARDRRRDVGTSDHTSASFPPMITRSVAKTFVKTCKKIVAQVDGTEVDDDDESEPDEQAPTGAEPDDEGASQPGDWSNTDESDLEGDDAFEANQALKTPTISTTTNGLSFHMGASTPLPGSQSFQSQSRLGTPHKHLRPSRPTTPSRSRSFTPSRLPLPHSTPASSDLSAGGSPTRTKPGTSLDQMIGQRPFGEHSLDTRWTRDDEHNIGMQGISAGQLHEDETYIDDTLVPAEDERQEPAEHQTTNTNRRDEQQDEDEDDDMASVYSDLSIG